MFQHGQNSPLPFAIKKVLIMRGMKPGDKRAQHAHHKTTEILTVIQGGCTVELDDGAKKKESIEMKADMAQALLLPPRIWRTLKRFQKNTILLVIADTKYDEADYIRDYESFIECYGRG